jgi:hypothetical protein
MPVHFCTQSGLGTLFWQNYYFTCMTFWMLGRYLFVYECFSVFNISYPYLVHSIFKSIGKTYYSFAKR